MGERKDIDRIFQEKFKDFEKSPSPEMWTRIEQELNKDKKKRRFIPIWWQLGGAAAVLLLFISVGLNWFGSPQEGSLDQPIIVDSETEILEETPQDKLDNNSFDDNSSKEGISNGLTGTEAPNFDESDSSAAEITEKGVQNFNANPNTLAKIDEAETVLNDEKTSSQKEYAEVLNLKQSGYHSSSLAVTANVDLGSKQDDDMGPIYEGQTIEEAMAEAEDLKIENEKIEKQARWRLSPVVAPVYSTAIGEGSTFHTQFIENSKSSDITMSYGINGSYAISKRFKVRAGVNRVDFSNSTNDVLAFEALDVASQTSPAVIANISPAKNSNVLLVSGTSVNRSSTPESINTMQSGDMTLDYGFIEIPLAVEYRMLDQRFGINVVGGFSTFFLNNNQISVDLNNTNTVIGEANNINDTSYSANFGLGFDYSISRSFDIMLEPTFKYQFNTFSNTFGDVQPYFIGVYTGLNFKF